MKTPAKVISALMIVSMLLGFAAIFTATVKAQGTPTVFVSPQNNIFPPPIMNEGSTFSVNVTIANTTDVAGIQFTLSWDPTLLTCDTMTDVFYHDPLITNSSDIPSNIEDLSGGITTGSASYAITWKNGPKAVEDGYDPANITETGSAFNNPTYAWPSGQHAIAEFVFTVLSQPNDTVPSLSCALALSGVIIGNEQAVPISVTTVDGLYQNTYTIVHPYFSLTTSGPGASGSTYTASTLGEIFNVSVIINNVDPALNAIGYQFDLGYNSSLLQVLNYWNGSFLDPFGAAPNQGVLWMYLNSPGSFGYGELVEPQTNGTWSTPYPSGTGVLATIEFNCTMQSTFGGPELTCPLTITDEIVANTTADVVSESQSPVNGVYFMKAALPPIVGRQIDIYTQWPAPYGGQGFNMPSDMFWPEKAVTLYANVTYNGYAEQDKDVAFQLIAPNNVNNDNETWAVLYATTDANGIATVTFTLPWPCNDPQQWFGVWTVIGTVDIACTIVNDTLWFHYDYLVNIFKQTVDMPLPSGSYNHTQTITVTINYGTYLQETDAVYLDELTNGTLDLSNVTVVVTALDNLEVPFSFIGAQLPLETTTDGQVGNASEVVAFGGAPSSLTGPPPLFSNYINFTVTLTIYIPKFAAAGFGTVECAVLNTWPSLGGTVISGYQDPVTGLWTPYCPTGIYINAI